MRAAVTKTTVILCALAFAATSVHAGGTVYIDTNIWDFGPRTVSVSANQPPSNSFSSAANACRLKSSSDCQFFHAFHDTCFGFAWNYVREITYEFGASTEVIDAAFKKCDLLNHGQCNPGFVLCDQPGGLPTVHVEDVSIVHMAPTAEPSSSETILNALTVSVSAGQALAIALFGIFFLIYFLYLIVDRFERQPLQAAQPEPSFHTPPPPLPQTTPETTSSPPSPSLPVVVPEPEPPPRVIDTAAAIRALKLASAYFEEASDAMDNLSDELAVKNIQTTLSLAAKQLDKAATADPHAILETDHGAYTQERLRSLVLMKEAVTWQAIGKSSKAIGIATEATRADPTCATAWYTQGALHYEQRNRQEAVSALEKAIELDPDFMDALMLHDRAQNLGDAEIAVFKVVNARDKTLDGVATGVRIIRIPIMIVALPFVMMFKIGRHFYRAWHDPWYWMR